MMRARHLVLVPALLAAIHAALLWGFVVDDAWISLRYARNLAGGEGLVWNPGERVEGYSNFAWVVLSAMAHSVGLPVASAMAILGLACAVATVAATALVARRWHGDRAAIVAGAIVASSSGFALHAVAGLETALFALVALVSVAALVERRALAFAVATSLAFLVRPEAGLIGVAGVVVLVVAPAAGGRRDALRAAGVMALMLAPYLGWKLAYFGSIVPNTLRAKPGDAITGAVYAGSWLLPAAGVLVAAIARVARRARDRRDIEVLSIAALFVAGVVVTGGDWMPGHRRLAVVLPLVALAAAPQIAEWLRRGEERAGVVAIGALVLVAGFVGWQAFETAQLRVAARGRQRIDAARARLAASWEREGVESVALLDVGLVGWLAPSVRIVDLAGLTDAEIARAPGGHGEKRPDERVLESRAPSIVVLTSGEGPRRDGDSVAIEPRFGVERYIARSRWLRDRYRYVRSVEGSSIYWMHLYARR